jgi:cytochrome c553
MKAGGFRVIIQAAFLAIFMPVAAQAGGKGDVDEKLGYCRNCHGSHYEGLIGYYVAPRLAGQQAEYLENQLKAIGKHTRDDENAKRFMWPVLTHGTPDLWPRIAKRLSQMDAPPAADGPRRFVDAGRKIFEEGVPDDNIPACAACHGQDGHGMDQVPRVAGQLYDYLVESLNDWVQGHRKKDPVTPTDDNTMYPIAKSLNKEQIRAVAAFLSYQK